MKNIVAKIPGDKPGILMLATHYDTKLLPNFIGADDAGSSTAVMLELARLLCRHWPRQPDVGNRVGMVFSRRPPGT